MTFKEKPKAGKHHPLQTHSDGEEEKTLPFPGVVGNKKQATAKKT